MSDYLDNMAVQYGVDVEDTDTALPTKLPDTYSDPILRPSLAPAGRELEEYRVRTAAQQMGLDPDIAAGVAFQESGFNPKAVSPTGVRGTMQVTKPTAKGLGYNRDIPDENIRAGIALLKQGFDKHPDNIKKALRRYPAPKDRRHWIPSVIGHSIKAKENRANRPQTIEDIASEIPDDLFTVPTQPVQDTPSEAVGAPSVDEPSTTDRILSSLIAINPAAQPVLGGEDTPSAALDRNLSLVSGFNKGSGGEFMGRMVGKVTQPVTDPIIDSILSLVGSKQTAETSRAGSKERLTQAEQSAPTQEIIGKILGTLTPGGPLARTAQVSGKVAGAIPKIGKYIAPSLIGATGAAEYTAMQEDSTVKDVAISAGIGAAIPPVIKGLATSVKALSNKIGDMVIGKTNMGKWVNDTFGKTKSLKSLQSKNQSMYQETEKRLQETLNKYGKVNVKIPKDTLTPDMIRQTAKEALSDRAPQEVVDQLNYLAGRLMQTGHLQPYELNIIKRSMYADAYSAAGKMKGSAYAKNTAKIASRVKKLIEDNTDETVAILNEQESKHIALSAAVSKKLAKKPSAWSLFAKVIPALSMGGGATAAGGPVAGAATTAATLAAQTTPGFTGMSAAAKSAENPELLRILSTLLPQFMK